MDSGAGPGSASRPEPEPLHVTPELLADLQAGLLDDTTAVRVRRHTRADPEAAGVLAGLDAVRRHLAHLGSDERSAPEVPAAVTARVGAALRSAPPLSSAAVSRHHAPARPKPSGAQRSVIVAGIGAVGVFVILGALVATGDSTPTPPAGPAAAHHTVEQPAHSGFPLSDADLRGALVGPAELGPLADPQRRAACFEALGHSPASAVLGGRPVEVSGRPGVLLLFRADTPGQISAVVVEPTCSGGHAGLLAETVLAAP